VVAVIYSHSHADHYGGVKDVISVDEVQAGRVAVIAPDGFMEAVGGENVLAGNAMIRRAQFQFGGLLPKGPRGQFMINWLLADSGEQAALTLQNSTLTHVMGKRAPETEVSVTMTRAVLVALNLRRVTMTQAIEAGDATIAGHSEILEELFDMLDDFEMMFDIVTPSPAEG
jgi:alkyl sulfatase BDS1-like metallo-beta-lactamase superfamily hydrolase